MEVFFFVVAGFRFDLVLRSFFLLGMTEASRDASGEADRRPGVCGCGV